MLLPCNKNGLDGWKWGTFGTCFIGPNAKIRATERAKQSGDFYKKSSNKIVTKVNIVATEIGQELNNGI